MGFYNFSKEEREKIINNIKGIVRYDIESVCTEHINIIASDPDTYIRKNCYLAIGKLFRESENLREKILIVLSELFNSDNEAVRQTVVYVAGEIGKTDVEIAFGILEKAFGDKHNSVRNAVIGALKQLGEKKPEPTLKFARKFLHNPDPKIRCQIIHGIELRGRTNPEDILPLLEELQEDKNKKVRKMIIHVLGQISYKKGCLEKVTMSLKQWGDRELVGKAIDEIVSVHKRYEKFSAMSCLEAKKYLEKELST